MPARTETPARAAPVCPCWLRYSRAVMLSRSLPQDPAIFTLAHELKHHLVDSKLPITYCDMSNVNEQIEIGAEVFAAELLFPDDDFVHIMQQMKIGNGECSAEAIVELKRSTNTTLSYAGLVKKAEFLGFVCKGSLTGTKWTRLEEQLYGEPVYKRINRYRAVKRANVERIRVSVR